MAKTAEADKPAPEREAPPAPLRCEACDGVIDIITMSCRCFKN